jgi:hypothetical protein
MFPYDQCFFPSLQVQDRAESLGCSDMALFDIISTHEITVNIIHSSLSTTMIVGAELILMVIIHPAQKNRSQKQMFQMFDALVAVDGHALLLVQNYEC